MSDVVQEVKALLEKVTPGEWCVKYHEFSHADGSPACAETCGKHQTPIRVEAGGMSDGPFAGRDLHVMGSEFVQDIVAGGTHVVCFGHDYSDSGSVKAEDAEFIAAAPRLVGNLIAKLAWQPIATAPKDRRPVLIVYRSWEGNPIVTAGNWDGQGWRCGVGGVTPTHWMPLPDPPSE
jgi:hypothetical protein